jgi:hypothetical protein
MVQTMLLTSNLIGDQPHYQRRLADKIQAAFDHACEDGELITASELLNIFELVLLRTPPSAEQRDTIVRTLMACQERLWHLKQTAAGQRNAESGST